MSIFNVHTRTINTSKHTEITVCFFLPHDFGEALHFNLECYSPLFLGLFSWQSYIPGDFTSFQLFFNLLVPIFILSVFLFIVYIFFLENPLQKRCGTITSSHTHSRIRRMCTNHTCISWKSNQFLLCKMIRLLPPYTVQQQCCIIWHVPTLCVHDSSSVYVSLPFPLRLYIFHALNNNKENKRCSFF